MSGVNFNSHGYLPVGTTGTSGYSPGSDSGYESEPEDIAENPVSGGGPVSLAGATSTFDVDGFLAGLTPAEKGALNELLGILGNALPGLLANPEQIPDPAEAALPVGQGAGGAWKRPTERPDKSKTAEDIINDPANKVLKNLGDQKDIKVDLLKKRFGDWTADNPDPNARADAAYRAAETLKHIDTLPGANGQHRGAASGDGDISGITKDGDARHGTEAGVLKDFAEKGWEYLEGLKGLPKTKDSHVRMDGTNKDDFQWFLGEVGKKIFFIPGLSNVLQGIGESKNGIGGMFLGGLSAVLKTWEGAASGIVDGLKKGRINPASVLASAYMGALETSMPSEPGA